MFIDTVLLKVASRCNLDCDYCYVYHMGDAAWRDQPKRFTLNMIDLVSRQLGALRKEQGRPFSIVLHGGEPLLLGADVLNHLLDALRAELDERCGISIQTNGILINDAILDICDAQSVTLSVSLDGPAAIHDLHRYDHRRRPSYERVLAGINRLKNHRASDRLFSGILAVVDPETDPGEVYRFFKELGVPAVDFLYRDGNHSTLPYRKASPDSIEYGSWMSKILRLYISDPIPFRIRMLDDMLKLLLGGQGVKEGVGLTDFGILVIDTDGSVKKNDTLKSASSADQFDESWSLTTTTLTDICNSYEFEEYHRAQRPSSPVCGSCPLLKVCGGGMLTHRYKNGEGFDNPTIYCADQKYLIAMMQKWLMRTANPAMLVHT